MQQSPPPPKESTRPATAPMERRNARAAQKGRLRLSVDEEAALSIHNVRKTKSFLRKTKKRDEKGSRKPLERFLPSDRKILNEILKTTAYPNSALQESLAQLLDTSRLRIRRWFEYQRYKEVKADPNHHFHRNACKIDDFDLAPMLTERARELAALEGGSRLASLERLDGQDDMDIDSSSDSVTVLKAPSENGHFLGGGDTAALGGSMESVGEKVERDVVMEEVAVGGDELVSHDTALAEEATSRDTEQEAAAKQEPAEKAVQQESVVKQDAAAKEDVAAKEDIIATQDAGEQAAVKQETLVSADSQAPVKLLKRPTLVDDDEETGAEALAS